MKEKERKKMKLVRSLEKKWTKKKAFKFQNQRFTSKAFENHTWLVVRKSVTYDEDSPLLVSPLPSKHHRSTELSP